MPSPEHAADLERVLTRAAEECETGTAWFGDGLPQALRSAIEATREPVSCERSELAFIEAGRPLDAPPSVTRVIALSAAGIDELATVVRRVQDTKPRAARLICPVAVLDFTAEGIRVREIQHGFTAVDIQARLGAPLWSGPDLKEMGSH